MLTQTIKEIAKSREVDATQIAEVLWLSQFMTVSSSKKITVEPLETPKEKKSLTEDALPRTVSHTIVIQSEEEKEEPIEHGFERESSSASTFSTVTSKQEEKKFNLEKAFKNLTTKVKRESSEALDEEKTAEYIALVGLFEPMFQENKVRENYFNLRLVIDQNSSMFLWQESIKSFVKSIKKLDAFKNLDIFYLDSSENEASFRREKSTRIIKHTSSLFRKEQTLTLVLSDVVGKAWRSNQMFKVLNVWSNYSFVTIVSMLPHSMWQKTPLRQGVSLFVTSRGFPVTNRKLIAEYETEELSEQLNIPIIPFDESAFGYLTNLLMAQKESWIDARLFYELPDYSNKTDNSIKHKDAKERVEKFFASASEETRLLAIYCSVLPLNKVIIEAVIAFKSLGKSLDAFAEFYFGGLLDKITSHKIVEYEFYEGVRTELMQYISVEEVKSLFYILNDVVSSSLKLNGTVLDLLFSRSEKSKKLDQREKDIADLLVKILGNKGRFFEKEIANLVNKKNSIYLETNSYQMGSNHRSLEKPIHIITFDYDFEIAKSPVTFEEYDLYCVDEGIEKPSDEGWGRGKRPVINVSWDDAQNYCKWLSRKTGKKYRLPTEAEWEYACRAGTTTKWSFKDNESELENYAWYTNNSKSKTQKVAIKKENPWGLFDMHGNVWEWCQDDWVDNYNDTPRDGTEYKDSSVSSKVVRGGSWVDEANVTRSANRLRSSPTYRDILRGFRLLRTLP